MKTFLTIFAALLLAVLARADGTPYYGGGGGGGGTSGNNSQIFWVGTNDTQLATVAGASANKFTSLYDVQNNVASGALVAAGPGSIIYVLPGTYTNTFLPFRSQGVQVIGLGQPTIQRSTVCNGINWTNVFWTSWKMLPWVALNDNLNIQGINFVSFTTASNQSTLFSSSFIGLQTPSTAFGWIGTNLQQVLTWNPGTSNEQFGTWPEFLYTNRLGTNVQFQNCNVNFAGTIDCNYINAYHLDCFDTNDVNMNTNLDVPFWGNTAVTFNSCAVSSGWDLNVFGGPEVNVRYINCTLSQTLFNTNSGLTGIFTAAGGASITDVGSTVSQVYAGGGQNICLATALTGAIYQDSKTYKSSVNLIGTRLRAFGTNATQYINFGGQLAGTIVGSFVDTNGYLYDIHNNAFYLANNGINLTNFNCRVLYTNFNTGQQTLSLAWTPFSPAVGTNITITAMFLGTISAADAIYFTGVSSNGATAINVGVSTGSLPVKFTIKPDFN